MADARAFDLHTLFTGLGAIPMSLALLDRIGDTMATGGDFHDASAAMFGRPATESWPLRAPSIPPDGQDPPDWPRPGIRPSVTNWRSIPLAEVERHAIGDAVGAADNVRN